MSDRNQWQTDWRTFRTHRRTLGIADAMAVWHGSPVLAVLRNLTRLPIKPLADASREWESGMETIAPRWRRSPKWRARRADDLRRQLRANYTGFAYER